MIFKCKIMNNCFFGHLHTKKELQFSFPSQSPFSAHGTRPSFFRNFADAFLMMYQTAAAQIFTNIGAFGGFCHGNPVSLERVHSGDFGMEKACKRQNLGVYRLLDRWQGQNGSNARHAVLESLSRFAAIDYCLLCYHLFTRMIFDF